MEETAVEPGTALVSLGSLRSPSSDAAVVRRYADVVGRSAVEALQASGAKRILVCGNVPPDFKLFGSGVSARALMHRDFLRAAQRTEHLVVVPGLTTLLELDALERPALVLPPQNLSSFTTARTPARNSVTSR